MQHTPVFGAPNAAAALTPSPSLLASLQGFCDWGSFPFRPPPPMEAHLQQCPHCPGKYKSLHTHIGMMHKDVGQSSTLVSQCSSGSRPLGPPGAASEIPAASRARALRLSTGGIEGAPAKALDGTWSPPLIRTTSGPLLRPSTPQLQPSGLASPRTGKGGSSRKKSMSSPTPDGIGNDVFGDECEGCNICGGRYKSLATHMGMMHKGQPLGAKRKLSPTASGSSVSSISNIEPGSRNSPRLQLQPGPPLPRISVSESMTPMTTSADPTSTAGLLPYSFPGFLGPLDLAGSGPKLFRPMDPSEIYHEDLAGTIATTTSDAIVEPGLLFPQVGPQPMLQYLMPTAPFTALDGGKLAVPESSHTSKSDLSSMSVSTASESEVPGAKDRSSGSRPSSNSSAVRQVGLVSVSEPARANEQNPTAPSLVPTSPPQLAGTVTGQGVYESSPPAAIAPPPLLYAGGGSYGISPLWLQSPSPTTGQHVQGQHVHGQHPSPHHHHHHHLHHPQTPQPLFANPYQRVTPYLPHEVHQVGPRAPECMYCPPYAGFPQPQQLQPAYHLPAMQVAAGLIPMHGTPPPYAVPYDPMQGHQQGPYGHPAQYAPPPWAPLPYSPAVMAPGYPPPPPSSLQGPPSSQPTAQMLYARPYAQLPPSYLQHPQYPYYPRYY